ncbi:unnamed protein product [marine sediment metagenome]|uniref:Uncharacterized protein n=1 Tax=marine sediment metagenome TaxID=412755 RepID=X1SHN2_9ZZZZ
MLMTMSFAKATIPVKAIPIINPCLSVASSPRKSAGKKMVTMERKMPAIEIKARGPVLINHFFLLYSILLAINPAMIGIIIMLNIENIISTKSIGTSLPARIFIKKGVITGDISVEQEVIVTESATLPPAR